MTTHADHRDVVPYPDADQRRYFGAGIWQDRTIAQQFRATAEAWPDRPALVSENVTLTYAELDRRSDHIAVGLRKAGLSAGEPALLQLSNDETAILAWYGLLKAGLIPVASLTHHRSHELTGIAAVCQPSVHFVDTSYAACDLVDLAAQVAAAQPSIRMLVTTGTARTGSTLGELEAIGARVRSAGQMVDEYQREIGSTTMAVLQLSGGTTSTPKLIPRLHTEYWYNAWAYANAIDIEENGCVAHALPIVHNAGITCAVHTAHSVGAAVAVLPHDADVLRTVASRVPITHMMISPPMAAALVRRPDLVAALGSMQEIAFVLGKLPSSLVAAFESGTCRVAQMFGQGEGLCMHTPATSPPDIRHRTVGTPLSEFDEVRVLAPGTERDVQPGEPGELCCRGPYTIRGYYRAPERNREAFTSDGFYRTGDIVVERRPWNSQRFFTLSDRIKDVISRGGEKVNAVEVEELLLRHPDIDQAAVVAMPDERLGERACAFIVLTPDAAPIGIGAVRDHLAALGVAKFKYPERIEIRTELPMTGVTKLNKVALRAEIAAILEAERAEKAAAKLADAGPTASLPEAVSDAVEA